MLTDNRWDASSPINDMKPALCLDCGVTSARAMVMKKHRQSVSRLCPLEDAGVPGGNMDGQTGGVQLFQSGRNRGRRGVQQIGEKGLRSRFACPFASVAWDVDVCIGILIRGEITDDEQGAASLCVVEQERIETVSGGGLRSLAPVIWGGTVRPVQTIE